MSTFIQVSDISINQGLGGDFTYAYDLVHTDAMSI